MTSTWKSIGGEAGVVEQLPMIAVLIPTPQACGMSSVRSRSPVRRRGPACRRREPNLAQAEQVRLRPDAEENHDFRVSSVLSVNSSYRSLSSLGRR